MEDPSSATWLKPDLRLIANYGLVILLKITTSETKPGFLFDSDILEDL
jgi:hypothetical protein